MDNQFWAIMAIVLIAAISSALAFVSAYHRYKVAKGIEKFSQVGYMLVVTVLYAVVFASALKRQAGWLFAALIAAFVAARVIAAIEMSAKEHQRRKQQ